MEVLNHRTALKHGFFDLQRDWAWYLKRCGGRPQETLAEEFVDFQTKILNPFTPHIAEEIWGALGRGGYIQTASWPVADPVALDPAVEASEELVRKTLEDVRQILKVTGLKPSLVRLYVAPPWKREVYRRAAAAAREDKLDVGVLIKGAMAEVEQGVPRGEVGEYCKRIADVVRRLSRDSLARFGYVIDEETYLKDASSFLGREVEARVEVYVAGGEGEVPDPQNKGRQAIPWRPAIYVE
jgi:leucyl-tRNA synthetase